MEYSERENRIYARHVGGSDWEWSFVLLPESEEASNAEDAFYAEDLLLMNQNTDRELHCPLTVTEKQEDGSIVVTADLSPLKATIENCKIEKWRVCIGGRQLVNPALVPAENRPKKKKDAFRRRFEFYEEPVGETEFEGRTVDLMPSCSAKGEWKIYVGDRCLRYMGALKCVLLDFRFNGRKPHFKVSCPHIDGFEWKGLVLTYRYQLESDRKDWFFPIAKSTMEGKRLIAEIDIDPDANEYEPVYWGVRMVFEKDGEEFWTFVRPAGQSRRAVSASFKKRMRNLFTRQSIDMPGDCRLSITDTSSGNTTLVVQKRSPYSGFLFRLKERVAIAVYLLLKKSLRKKRIFLVYEKYCAAAQENGYYYFKYCMENDMESVMKSHIYYVIDKSQPDYERLLPYKDHVIQFMSIRHMVYILASRLLISSDSKLHAYAWRATESIIRPRILDNKKLVFLQHGVIGLKRVDIFERGLPEGCNLFITSNDMERGFIINSLKYLPEEGAVTGLCRWDVLTDKSAETDGNRILIMPTWRKWLNEPSEEMFLASEYYRRYMELINSEGLAELLDKHDLYLDFHIHPKLSEHLKQFSADNDRIKLIPFGSVPVNELLMKCRLIVTDYSSVCWDVYYQGKPVIFYQFDLDKYNEVQGAYMDLENDLFGDRAETLEDLLKLLEESAEEEFNLKPKYAKMRDGMFKYIDHNNSKRICEEIMKRGW